jgi:N-carbamoylputrescine amidase
MQIALAQVQPGPDLAANRADSVALMEEAAAAGAQVIVFPELAHSPFFPQKRGCAAAKGYAEPIPGPTTGLLCVKARELSLVTVFNLYEIDAQGRCYDSSPVIDADGRLLGATRMVHITDFAGFHEREYYHPGDRGPAVYETRAGRIGVAICYDRHFPEYMRALGLAGAQLVVIPQAGVVGEWPPGVFEGEVQVAAFQNGYFAALCNRVGPEDNLTFAGESFVANPEGRVIFRAPTGEPGLFLADCDLAQCESCTARQLFWKDRRPDLYATWLGLGGPSAG